MKNKAVILLLLVMLAACGKHEASSANYVPAAESAPATMGRMADASTVEMAKQLEPSSGEQSENRKYIAMRHHLTVEVASQDMQAVFDATLAHCERLKCQILSANFNREMPYQSPSASISVRVLPQSVEAFVDYDSQVLVKTQG
jgi:hypothetical protein